ncbi:MAG: GGDEF domain-containing protein, partial [Deltaproteobacteria bacterium]
MITKQPVSPQQLRQRAEELFQASENLIQEPTTPEETKQLFHELRVHQIELEMQNEELRCAQADLDASQARYFDLYDLAPVGYMTFGEPGLIL